MKISDWVHQAELVLTNTNSPRLDAELLVCHALGWERTTLLTRLDETLTEEVIHHLNKLLDRRMANEPLAYILGYKDFADFRVKVSPDVLIPRPETEAILNKAIELTNSLLSLQGDHESDREDNLVVYEIGTGSGAIAIGLARALPRVHVVASDISERALAVARENIDAFGLGGRVEILQSDLGDHISHASLLVANLPYLPTGLSVSAEVKKEPSIALWSGTDGLDHYRKLLSTTSFDTAVIELGADQYSLLKEWMDSSLQGYEITPIRNIDQTISGAVIVTTQSVCE